MVIPPIITAALWGRLLTCGGLAIRRVESCARSRQADCQSAAGYQPAPQILLLPHLLQPLLQILLVFLLQRRIFRAAINVARFILPLVELLARPLVVNVDRI